MTTLAVSLVVVLAAGPARAQQPADTTTTAPPAQATAPSRDESDQDSTKKESLLDRARRLARRMQIIERINGTIDGWYPRLGGMTRGSGFVVGPGYRTHMFGDVLGDFSGAISTRLYTAADARIRWARALHDRLEVWTDLRAEDYPQEDYYGIGRRSRLQDQTSYDFSNVSADGRVVMTIKPHMRVGTQIGILSPSIGRGTDPEFPSIADLFTDRDAPGLDAQPTYVNGTLFLDVDHRDTPGNPARGGLYHVSAGFWHDTTLHEYDFKRFDVNAVQYFPLTSDKRHVISGRFGLSTLNNAPGDRVPFYFYPYVGGSDTVRSLNEFRFKDENAIWAGVEYTWTPVTYLSLAAFMDTGKVAHGWDEVNFAGMTQGYGLGFRLHTATQRLARVDVAAGGAEGWQVMVKLGPSF